jgi:surface antigen
MTKVLAGLLTLGIIASGCDGVTKQQIGTGLGAAAGAAGGIFGAKALGGGRTGQVIGGVGGALIGGVVGNQIGRYLDDRDKQQLAKATVEAAETGKTQTVSGAGSGTTMRAEVVGSTTPPQPASQQQAASPSPPPAPSSPQPGAVQPQATQTVTAPQAAPSQAAQTAASGERMCRTVRQTIVLKNGAQQQEDVTVCKGPNGWETAG